MTKVIQDEALERISAPILTELGTCDSLVGKHQFRVGLDLKDWQPLGGVLAWVLLLSGLLALKNYSIA